MDLLRRTGVDGLWFTVASHFISFPTYTHNITAKSPVDIANKFT